MMSLLVPRAAAETMMGMGFYKPSDMLLDSHNRYLGMKAGSIAGADTLRSNPWEWYQSIFKPKMGTEQRAALYDGWKAAVARVRSGA